MFNLFLAYIICKVLNHWSLISYFSSFALHLLTLYLQLKSQLDHLPNEAITSPPLMKFPRKKVVVGILRVCLGNCWAIKQIYSKGESESEKENKQPHTIYVINVWEQLSNDQWRIQSATLQLHSNSDSNSDSNSGCDCDSESVISIFISGLRSWPWLEIKMKVPRRVASLIKGYSRLLVAIKPNGG